MEYQKMAAVYDALMEDAPYDLWFQFFCEVLKEQDYNLSELTVADLGCGTGEMTKRLSKRARYVYGVDMSEAMLTEAQAKTIDTGSNVQWIKQDITKLQGLSQLDVAVSFFDVVNYLVELENIEQFFMCVYEALNKEGLFIFDVHSLHQVETAYVGETFAVVYDELSYIWFCQRGDYRGEMFHDLTFFIQSGEQYDRFEELHHQRTYSVDTFTETLQKAGFKKVKWYSEPDVNSKKNDENAPRIFFIAQK